MATPGAATGGSVDDRRSKWERHVKNGDDYSTALAKQVSNIEAHFEAAILQEMREMLQEPEFQAQIEKGSAAGGRAQALHQAYRNMAPGEKRALAMALVLQTITQWPIDAIIDQAGPLNGTTLRSYFTGALGWIPERVFSEALLQTLTGSTTSSPPKPPAKGLTPKDLVPLAPWLKLNKLDIPTFEAAVSSDPAKWKEILERVTSRTTVIGKVQQDKQYLEGLSGVQIVNAILQDDNFGKNVTKETLTAIGTALGLKAGNLQLLIGLLRDLKAEQDAELM